MNSFSDRIHGNELDESSLQARLHRRRELLVNRGKNALLTMLETGRFSSVSSIRLTNELGASVPYLVPVTGEAQDLHGDSVFNERFNSVDAMNSFVSELACVMFPEDTDGRSLLLGKVSSWTATTGSSVRIYPV